MRTINANWFHTVLCFFRHTYLGMWQAFAGFLFFPFLIWVNVVSKEAGVALPRTTCTYNIATLSPCSIVRRPVILVKLEQLGMHKSSRIITIRQCYQIRAGAHLSTANTIRNHCNTGHYQGFSHLKTKWRLVLHTSNDLTLAITYINFCRNTQKLNINTYQHSATTTFYSP